MLRFLSLFLLLVFPVYAGFEVYSHVDWYTCSYAIQVNEDGEVLLAISGRHPGEYQERWCFGTSEDGCYVDLELPNGAEDIGRQYFNNSKGEICFLEDL